MSAEDDDTFDIDIYGDDTQQQDEPTQAEYDQQENQGNDEGFGYDGAHDANDHNLQSTVTQAAIGADYNDDEEIDFGDAEHVAQSAAAADNQAPPLPGQGTKRKAPDDEHDEEEVQQSIERPVSQQSKMQPVDPSATPALKVNDLHWWTTEEDVRDFCARAGIESELKDLTFAEHKINGKSRGEAYLEFTNPGAATAAKREIDKAREGESAGAGVKKTPFTVLFTAVGNPFKTGTGVGEKKFAGGGGPTRGGAYNNSGFSNRGSFSGRGAAGGFQNRGGGAGGFNNNNNQGYRPNPQQQQQQQGGWGMNGGFNSGGGFAANPMMAGFANMGMGGFGGMNRGGGGGAGMMGMNNRGGGMNPMMGGMGGMNNRGGMMGAGMGMMGRGGWGGFNQQQGWGGGGGGFQGGGGGAGMQQQGNKRAKYD
ncbi:hypothetical protein LTR37_018909 [Vermiconidia calcicola]|uniref:Uncharacterized protein n=1 Tax=Vermiconidia calcicola TaxID=1690605 RepID=A0ACC3MGV6_9PEZI|nr:hypothetical protein LTR37_018909 [Vermiconidia calcicola]